MTNKEIKASVYDELYAIIKARSNHLWEKMEAEEWTGQKAVEGDAKMEELEDLMILISNLKSLEIHFETSTSDQNL